jgi:hypothetical protein
MDGVKLRTPTLDLIATEYAEAVAAGEFERAEGWLAVAEFAVRRQDDRGRPDGHSSAPRPLPIALGARGRTTA